MEEVDPREKEKWFAENGDFSVIYKIFEHKTQPEIGWVFFILSV